MADLLPNELYDKLYAAYGDLHWWPADTPYEVIVGAILTQNTAWGNVTLALNNFAGRLSPQFVLHAEPDALMEIIRPAGFFNQKCAYLKTVTAWFEGYGFDVETVRKRGLPRLRDELLALRGVGPETADSILLYAFDLPTFVVDAYTKRLLSRLTRGKAPTSYGAIKSYFEAHLDASRYGNMHALIVEHAKTHCCSKPRCAGCPLRHSGLCPGIHKE
jgi:endonuclease-3 related protein